MYKYNYTDSYKSKRNQKIQNEQNKKLTPTRIFCRLD